MGELHVFGRDKFSRPLDLHILLADSLSQQEQRETFVHELVHVYIRSFRVEDEFIQLLAEDFFLRNSILVEKEFIKRVEFLKDELILQEKYPRTLRTFEL